MVERNEQIIKMLKYKSMSFMLMSISGLILSFYGTYSYENNKIESAEYIIFIGMVAFVVSFYFGIRTDGKKEKIPTLTDGDIITKKSTEKWAIPDESYKILEVGKSSYLLENIKTKDKKEIMISHQERYLRIITSKKILLEPPSLNSLNNVIRIKPKKKSAV